MSTFYAVVMAGGSGTRFWPMSRRHLPKQLLPLVGGRSLVRQTVERLFPLFPADRIFVVCGRAHRDLTQRELEILPSEHVIDEPEGRDTAAAVGLAASYLEWKEPGATFAMLSADHHIGDVPAFHAALRRAFDLAQDGSLVTFGIRPTRPATGFGYLEADGERVARYCEKPDLARAKEFVASGRHWWNAGIFVWKAASILREIERHLPQHHASLQAIGASFGTTAFPGIFGVEYAKIPRISIDYGVMEKAKGVKMVKADFAWDDVGSWAAAAAHREKDADGNAVEALSARVETRDSVILSSDDGHLVATLGIRDLVVVHTKDATLVCPRDRAEDLKKLVDEVKARGLERYL